MNVLYAVDTWLAAVELLLALLLPVPAVKAASGLLVVPEVAVVILS
jgi:hypothetical protein